MPSVFCLWRAHRSARSLSESQRRRNRELARQRFRLPTLRLGLHMANFAVFNFPFAAMLFTTLIDTKLYESLPGCLTLSGRYILYQLMNYWAVLCITLRILIDVVIGFGVNTELRRSLGLVGRRISPKQVSATPSSTSRLRITESTTVM